MTTPNETAPTADLADEATETAETAELYSLPENFANLDAAALTELAVEIKSLAAGIEDRTAGRALLRSYAAAVTAVNGALSDLAADAEAAAALAADTPVVPEFAAGGGGGGADDEEEEEEDEEAGKPFADSAAADLTADATADLAAEADASPATTTNEQDNAVTASGGASITKIEDRQTALAASRDERLKPSAAAHSRVGFKSAADGRELSFASLAEEITRTRVGMGNHEGAPTRVAIGTANRSVGDFTFASDVKANDSKFRSVSGGRVERASLVASGAMPAVVAAGGPCAPLTPSFEFFTTAEVQSPVQDWLDFVDGDRGGLRYTPAPDFAFLSAGLQINECDMSTVKPFVHVNACPPEEEVCVRAISKRVRFDNLNYRVYPELVEYMLNHVAVLESELIERFLLGRIDEEANAAVVVPAAALGGYGSTRGVLGFIIAAADRFRRSKHMSRDAVVDLMIPDVFIEIVKSDAHRDLFNGGAAAFNMPMVDLQAELLRRCKVNLGTYYYGADDPANIGTPVAGFPDAQHNGAGWEFPTVGRFYMMAPGSVVGVDGGDLDVGLYRDSALNNTNDLELFSERWLEVAHIGAAIDAFDVPFCDNGAGPAGVTAIAC